MHTQNNYLKPVTHKRLRQLMTAVILDLDPEAVVVFDRSKLGRAVTITNSKLHQAFLDAGVSYYSSRANGRRADRLWV